MSESECECVLERERERLCVSTIEGNWAISSLTITCVKSVVNTFIFPQQQVDGNWVPAAFVVIHSRTHVGNEL